MIVKALPKSDRDKFYQDSRVVQIVSLLLKDNTSLYKEIIHLITCNTLNRYQTNLESLSILVEMTEPQLIGLLEEYVIHLNSLFNDEKLIGNLRGAILEIYVHESLYSKYGDRSCLHLNCQIQIDSWCSKLTVDNFYFSHTEEVGESFECKIKPAKLDIKDLDNLVEIWVNSHNSIKPCVACFYEDKTIETRLERMPTYTDDICIFGLSNIRNISSS